jgi:hypothetical protein
VTGDDEAGEPQADPDFIGEEGTGLPLVPVLPIMGRRTWGSPTPVFVPKESTPLAEHEDGDAIPAYALWAMKYRRHGRLLNRADEAIRERYGTGDHAVYVIEDGRNHYSVSRVVGSSPDGCRYCLVARISAESYEQLVDDEGLTDEIFVDADEICLCSVYQADEAISNVLLVEEFASVDDVPAEYLPPAPLLAFTESPAGDE